LNGIFNFRSCIEGSEVSDLAGVVDVHFVYDVETTRALTEDEEKSMLDALEKDMIDSIFDSECRRRLENLRKLELESVSSGTRDTVQGGCTVTTDEATSCSRYSGSLKVGYNNQGSNHNELQATNSTLAVVARDMTDGNYLDDANFALLTKSWYGNAAYVTKISYIGASSNTANLNGNTSGSNAEAEEEGVTTLGRISISVSVMLFLGAILAIVLAHKSRQRQKRMARLAVLRIRHDDEYLKRQNKVLVEKDARDLALRSSNQDVHRCNTTSCISCSLQRPPTWTSCISCSQPKQYRDDSDTSEDSEAQTLHNDDTNDGNRPASLHHFDDEPAAVTFVPVKNEFGDMDRSEDSEASSAHKDDSDQGSRPASLHQFDDEPTAATFVPVQNEFGRIQFTVVDQNWSRSTWVGIVGQNTKSCRSLPN
jgi:hypothetical protein